MKIKFLTLPLFLLVFSNFIFAQDGIGIGGELLSPIGISYKVPINESSAITGALGFVLSDGTSSSTFEINYLSYRDNENINIGSGDLSPYIGAGVSLMLNSGTNDPLVALHVPFGIEYSIDSAPIEIYMDIGPYVVLNDPQSITLDSSLGFRYRF